MGRGRFADRHGPETLDRERIDVTALLDVFLRGIALSGQAVAIGGVFFVLVVLRPLKLEAAPVALLLARSLKLIVAGTVVVAAAQGLSMGIRLMALAEHGGWPIGDAGTTTYFRASIILLLGGGGLAAGCRAMRRGRAGARWWLLQLGCALVLAASSAWMSHAAARLGARAFLLGLDTLHQLAAAVWIGGLAHLLAAVLRPAAAPWRMIALRRFSAMAVIAVASLLAAGVGLSLSYIDGLQALLGTAYGLMVLAKAVIFASVLILGAMNFLAVRRVPDASPVSLARIRRFTEVELGLGVTVLLVAASLSSLPPAVDLVAERATLAEIGARLAPSWPTFASPAFDELPVRDRDSARPDEDRAWSEYNHHVAGLFVLAMGLLATVHGLGRARWARHWPLVFLGLAGFLFLRNDPEAWPLGRYGFWESLTDPTVLQHRLVVPVIVAFGIFEWMVRTGRFRAPRPALVFPILCAVSAGLLLTHAHSLDNLKEQLLIELTHVPLGILGLFVGWGRWLELRLPPPHDRVPGRLWPVGFTLVGVLLLLYREG
jgi:putative copper resistance protein D